MTLLGSGSNPILTIFVLSSSIFSCKIYYYFSDSWLLLVHNFKCKNKLTTKKPPKIAHVIVLAINAERNLYLYNNAKKSQQFLSFN